MTAELVKVAFGEILDGGEARHLTQQRPLLVRQVPVSAGQSIRHITICKIRRKG